MGLPGPPWAACPVTALFVVTALETVTLLEDRNQQSKECELTPLSDPEIQIKIEGEATLPEADLGRGCGHPCGIKITGMGSS